MYVPWIHGNAGVPPWWQKLLDGCEETQRWRDEVAACPLADRRLSRPSWNYLEGLQLQWWFEGGEE